MLARHDDNDSFLVSQQEVLLWNDKECGAAAKNSPGEFGRGQKEGGDTSLQYRPTNLPESFTLEPILAEDKPRQRITKQRRHFANKDPYSQSYGFSSSHVQM